jgi:hypothetical protein
VTSHDQTFFARLTTEIIITTFALQNLSLLIYHLLYFWNALLKKENCVKQNQKITKLANFEQGRMENRFKSRAMILKEFEFPMSLPDKVIIKSKASGIGF